MDRRVLMSGNALAFLALASVAASLPASPSASGAVDVLPLDRDRPDGKCVCGVIPAKGDRCRKCRKDGA